MLCYLIEITPDENEAGERSFMATCPSLPEVTTFGDTQGAAALHAIGAIEEAVAGRISDGADIPTPIESQTAAPGTLVAPLPLLTALKIALYREARAQMVTRAELCRRLGWKREQVERVFRIDHASRLDQLEAVFNKLGVQVNISLVHEAA